LGSLHADVDRALLVLEDIAGQGVAAMAA
jgi:hypothetical protein